MNWGEDIDRFLILSDKHSVRMLMIGGGAVNFHGYQRHSADVDFWIETTPENLQKLILVFQELGYDIEAFPPEVINQQQNISVKFSPVALDLELKTRFDIGKTFDEAFRESEVVSIAGKDVAKWRVLNYEDLIESKRRAGRPKDLLDIQQLKSIRNG